MLFSDSNLYRLMKKANNAIDRLRVWLTKNVLNISVTRQAVLFSDISCQTFL